MAGTERRDGARWRMGLWVGLAVIGALAAFGSCNSNSGGGSSPEGGSPSGAAGGQGGGLPSGGGSSAPGTPATARGETFDGFEIPAASWSADPVPDDGPFADGGLYWQKQGVTPPKAWRISQAVGQGGWLTIEAYTRDPARPLSEFVSVVPDPANPANQVLRVQSVDHTDATVLRSSEPLPERYRLSLRVGFPRFGDASGLNGYDGGETAEPWSGASAVEQNGFYWLTILDAVPRPHNNTWIHHHRKVVIDSDNHSPPWMEIWNGSQFVWSGEHPIMMFALDGRGPDSEQTGKPFLSYSAGAWQPSGKIRAVDSYLPDEWYQVVVERDGNRYTMQISGRFRYGGQQTYRASIDAAAECVLHYNRSPAELAEACVDDRSMPSLGSGFPNWPADSGYPDYFMFGDPHANYYEGHVLYDDVRLETP